MRSFVQFLRAKGFWIVVAVFACLAMREAVLQKLEDAFIEETARRVIRDAHAETDRDRVLALRDYVRHTVTFEGAPGAPGTVDTRPFFRATAEETLRSGLGYCGEDSRVFINLARSVGIEAQRVNLYGEMMHVVAEVELVPHQRLIVDAQSRPHIEDLELLDDVIQRPEYDDYYTLNLRRLHLGWLVSRIRFEMGPLTYWTENPHALSGALWMIVALLLLSARGARVALRAVLHRRGWVHRSAITRADLPAPVEVHEPVSGVVARTDAPPAAQAGTPPN